MVGARYEIVAFAQQVGDAVDRLTKAMYPPLNDAAILNSATALVSASEELVKIAKTNQKGGKLGWLDSSITEVLHNYKTLVLSIQKYRDLHDQSSDDEDYLTDA